MKTIALPFVLLCSVFVALATSLLAQSPIQTDPVNVVFDEPTPLPDITIDGAVAKIHTQGLFVTDRHFLVTGRLETKPKRALLLRFARSTAGDDNNANDLQVEYLDITPPETDGETLDHPGGFDVDANGIVRIPLSTSHRKGPALIQSYRIDPDQPLSKIKLETTVKVADHIGAICCADSKDNPTRMLGANWDTKTIYVIENGNVTKRIPQEETLSRGDPIVAIQDWKLLRSRDDAHESHRTRIVLSGLVKATGKSPFAKTKRPTAVVQVADIFPDGKVLHTLTLESRDDVARPLTNEGMAIHQGRLYLLPEDIGRGAKILSFTLPKEFTDFL